MGTKKVQVCLHVSEEVRDMLRIIAAEQMLKNPKKDVSISQAAAEIIYRYLECRQRQKNLALGGEKNE